jgi:hypothetical protein
MYKKDSAEYKDITAKRGKVKDDRNKLKEAYMATVKDWLTKLPKDSSSFKYYNGFITRYDARYGRYRDPVKALRAGAEALPSTKVLAGWYKSTNTDG